MAGEQEIITRFKGDISDLVASVDAGEKKVAGLEQPVVVPVSLDDKRFNASLGSAQQKFALLEAAAVRFSEKSIEGAAKSKQAFEALALNVGKLTEERKRLSQEVRNNDREFKSLNDTLKDSGVKSEELVKAIEENRRKHGELSAELVSVTANEKLLKKEASDAAKAMVSSADAAKQAALAVEQTTSAKKEAVAEEIRLAAANRETIETVKALIAEASKTPQGAAALAKNLNLAQQAALKALVSMGALSKEEAQVAADATKLINAQGKLPGEVVKSVSAYTSLRTQLRQSREELDRLIEASGGKLTPEIRAAAAAAGKLQDRFGDLNATINAFNPDKKFQAITGVIQNVAGGFTALQGVIALTGGNSDKVAQSLLKVQAALAVTQGLQSLFGGLKDNLKIIRLLLVSSVVQTKALTEAEVEAAIAAKLQGGETKGLAGFLNIAKASAQRLYATLIANPFIAVAAGIALVVAGIIAYTSKTKEAVETTDELIARQEKIAARNKFVVDAAGQQNLLKNEREFLDQKEAALKLNTEEQRKAAVVEAENDRKRKDGLVEAISLEQQISDEKLRQQELNKKLAEQQKAEKPTGGSRGAVFFGGSEEAKKGREDLKQQIADSKQRLDELNQALLVASGKTANEVRDAQLKAEEDRLNGVKSSSSAVIKVSEDEAAKRIAIQQQVQDILNKGENEIFLASLSDREKRNAQLAQEFDDRVAQIREAFDKRRKLAGEDPAKLAAIQKAEGEAITESIRQQEAEALKLKQDFDAEDIELAGKTAKELLDIEQKAADERRKLAEEQAQLQRENIEELSNFIDGAIGLLARRNEAERKAAEERLAGINDDFAAQLSANEAFDQSEQNRARKRQAILAEQASAIAAERDRIAEEDKQAREVRSKEFINFLLDELEKIVLINAAKIQATLAGEGAVLGPAGVIAGLAQGAIFALLIKALFAGVKAAIQGAYTGEELVGANGEKPIWSGRDGYLRRVHKNEGIVDAETNVKYLPVINAMRGGNFEKYVEQQYAMRRANEYLGSDDGRRMAISVMPAKFQDKNMVGEMKLTRAEQKRTNELLAALLVQRTTHNRRWNAA